MQRHRLLSGAVKRKIGFNSLLEMPYSLAVEPPTVAPSRRFNSLLEMRKMLNAPTWRVESIISFNSLLEMRPHSFSLDMYPLMHVSILYWRCAVRQVGEPWRRGVAFQFSIGDAPVDVEVDGCTVTILGFNSLLEMLFGGLGPPWFGCFCCFNSLLEMRLRSWSAGLRSCRL